jgi:HTH-type transcriptional regulator / antitoxin HipB
MDTTNVHPHALKYSDRSLYFECPMTEQEKKRIGNLVKSERLAHGMTQDDLAQKAGVSRDYIMRLEKGGTAMNLDDLGAVANTLGYTLHGFMQIEPPSDTQVDKQQLADNFMRNFAHWRISRALSLSQIASKAHIELNTMRAYSSGARFPSPKALKEIAFVLGTTPETLLKSPDTEEVTDFEPQAEANIKRRLAEMELSLRVLRDDMIKGFARIEALIETIKGR